MDIEEKIKSIKRSFRLYMNGVASHSMREKGLDYKLNWGISQADLRHIAASYDKDAALARRLWADNVRECKILATLLMPPTAMSVDEAVSWVTQAPSLETVESLVFGVLQHVDDAPALVGTILSAEESKANALLRLCAYHLQCRLARRGVPVPQHSASLLLESASADIHSEDIAMLRAVVNCLQAVADTQPDLSARVADVLKTIGLDLF